MAGESINSLITPEKNESDVKKMDSNSAENPSDEKATTKRRVPIYLRASTGSCHDICKYGKHHAFEEKPRESLRERISKSYSPKEPRSAKVIVKEERFEEKAVEPLRARIQKSSLPEQLKSVKVTIPGQKNKEKSVLKDRPSLDYTKRHSLPIKISPRTKSCSPELLCNSPRQKALPRSKTLLSDLSPAKKSSSEVSEVIKREILLPSEKDEALVKGGSSTDGKISRADKKTCDPSSVKPRLTNVKQASGDSYGDQTGRKVTSPILAMDKVSETPSVVRLSTPRLSPGKTTSSKTREAGRVRLSFSSSSSLKYRNGTGKSIGDDSLKTLCVIKTRMNKSALNPTSKDVGRVNLLPPFKSNGQDSEKTFCVINIKTENHASSSSSSSSSSISMSHAKSPSLLSCEEKDENDEIKGSGNGTDEIVSEKTVSIEIGKIRSSLPREDDEENIDEFISDEIISLESGKLQPPMPSSHEEIYPSSPSSSESSSMSSVEEGINSKVQSVKETCKILKRSKPVIFDGKSRVPVKLKFRRGKIIDPQPENNIPKRLRFRRRAGTIGNKADDSVPDIKKYIVIKTMFPNKTLRKADSFVSDNKKSTDVKPGTPNKTLKKSRTAVSAEDKYRSPLNLIHREKTVDLQTGNKSPTRLRFTRTRAPQAEDGKINLRRKIMKNAGGKNDSVGCEIPSRRVVLKHPEVQSKKNGQVLLNNVIEETASKLVESRKSKVKALVGAFETVISLQEWKASSH
ncbi:hypothetical protein OROGR_018271 [Orobanche gracilis]